jgi:N,N-dimethylformamidase
LACIAGAGGRREIASEIDGAYRGVEQALRLGSYVGFEEPPPLTAGEGFTLELWAWPTTPGTRVQILAGRHDGTRGFALGLDPLGRAALWLDGSMVATDRSLLPRTWYRLEASFDSRKGRAQVLQEPVDEWPGVLQVSRVEREASSWSEPRAPFLLAARSDPADAHYNGKLDSPRLLDAQGSVLAAWDLGGDFAADRVEDLSGRGFHGACVNLPMRGVTGKSWRGRTTTPALAPEDYSAIWFHDDDLEDARWEPSFELRVPQDLPSGVYAVRVSTEEGTDEIPFFVRPRPGEHAVVAVLMPTLSYLAYGNEHASWAKPIPSTPGLANILASVSERDRYAADQGLNSIYELHSDGSGVAYSSRRRPIVNLRSDYGMPLLLGAPHQFPADLELLTWLDGRDVVYDVLTDEDLHHGGDAVLRGYRVLLTGSHPEYWTQTMLDRLEEWLAAGGRLMYLGGNGFYWVTSLSPEHPHVLEVRRGHAGTGVWRSEAGELHHASTGEPGGLWRFRGRAPQRIAGVGFTAQGFDKSLPYRKLEGAQDPRASWIFEGVTGDEFGAYGSVLHGAAGFEIDRVDASLGTPPHTLTLAEARGFSDVYQSTSEDILTSDSQQGGTVSPLVRAEVAFFEGPSGGAVFATGSIAWCGALLERGSDNDVSRITENVLRRFAREAW